MKELQPYLANAFWLLVPILAFNALFTRQLPPAYHADVFDKGIPLWIRMPENLSRLLVMLFPLVMRLQISTSSQQLGLALYVAGTAVYFAAWGIQIAFPQNGWSTSVAGFMAPAYTPALWLLGIGLLGDRLTLPNVPCNPWIYWSVCGTFLAFHNAHTWLVYARTKVDSADHRTLADTPRRTGGGDAAR